MKPIKLASVESEIVEKEIGDFILDQITSIRKIGAVIGLSGGVDSTTTAALAKRAFEKYNLNNPDKKLELVGYIMPSSTNNSKDTEDGIRVANRLGIRYEIINIEPIVNSFSKSNPETLEAPYHKGNLMAESRAVVLHLKAATENKLLIGTGNRDEDFEIGYYTLFGDGVVHMSPIASLPKRLVRQMAKFLGFEDLADRTPTAGLEPGQTDFKDLGYDYDFIELVGEGVRQGFILEELAEHEQIKPLFDEQTEFYKKAFGRKKFENCIDAIRDVRRRNKIAQGKAKIVAPPVASVNLNYGEENDN